MNDRTVLICISIFGLFFLGAMKANEFVKEAYSHSSPTEIQPFSHEETFLPREYVKIRYR